MNINSPLSSLYGFIAITASRVPRPHGRVITAIKAKKDDAEHISKVN